MSWKTEVQADSSGTWRGNGLRFATEEEAKAYAKDLMFRWTSMRSWRTVEADEPVTDYWTGRSAQPLHVPHATGRHPDAANDEG